MIETIELKTALFVPPHNPAAILIAQLAEVLRERSSGQLLLRVCHSEQLGTTAQHYELARSGAADIAYMIHSATPGRFPLTELAALPPVPDALAGTDTLQRMVPGHLQAEHSGVKVLFLAANAPMAIHSVAPVRSIEDLKGKRVGHTGRVIAATLEALGAIPVSVMPLQICAALAKGQIDATSMTYEAALVVQLAKVAGYSFELNANTITFGLVMNARRYEALPSNLRLLVDEVLGASGGRTLAGKLTQAAAEGRRYMRGAGVAIVEPSAADKASIEPAIRSMVAAFIAERERENLPAQSIYDALKGIQA